MPDSLLQPLSAHMNNLSNKALDQGVELIVTLDQAAKTFEVAPQNATAFDAPIAILKAQIEEETAAVRRILIGNLALGSVFCLSFGIASVLSFSFVSRLRARKSPYRICYRATVV